MASALLRAKTNGLVLDQPKVGNNLYDRTRPLGGLRLRIHADLRAQFVDALELNLAIDDRVDREVAAHANVATEMKFRSTLANDDGAGLYSLATKALHAETASH